MATEIEGPSPRVRDLFVEAGATVEDIGAHHGNNYGDACTKFVLSNWDRYVGGLSFKQRRWLKSILGDLSK